MPHEPTLFSPDTAVAREGDPQTSHDAANSLALEELGKTRWHVLLLLDYGGMTDPELLDSFRSRGWPGSESGIRTRRGELVTKGLVEDSGGHRRSLSGRAMTVWRITDKGKELLSARADN